MTLALRAASTCSLSFDNLSTDIDLRFMEFTANVVPVYDETIWRINKIIRQEFGNWLRGGFVPHMHQLLLASDAKATSTENARNGPGRIIEPFPLTTLTADGGFTGRPGWSWGPFTDQCTKWAIPGRENAPGRSGDDARTGNRPNQ